MRRHIRLLTTILSMTFAAGPAWAATARVALVRSNDDARVGQIAALAEAEIAQRGDVQLLERQQIDRILREQQLSLSGLMDADHAIKAGRVLSADVIASLEGGKGSSALGLVIFDASAGVRLSDETVAASEDAACAEAIARGVGAALEKRRHVDTIRTVCLLAVRNADLPRGMDGFCDAVGRLLERNLVRSEGVALLERSRLEQVTRERALSDDARNRQLIASLIVINLDVARHDDGLAATALLSDASGKSIGKVTAAASSADAPMLAASLAASLARDANLPRTADRLDPAAEAARFGAEAAFRIERADFLRAIPPVEAAHALDPANLRYHAMLAQALIDSAKMIDYGRPPGLGAGVIVMPPPEQAPPIANRGAQTLVDVGAHYDAADVATRASVDGMLEDATEELCDYINWAFVPRRRTTPLQQPVEFSQARTALRQYLLRADARRLAAVKDARSFEAYSARLVQLLSDAQWICAQNSGEWTADFAALVDRWLALRDRYPDDHAAPVTDVLQAISIDWALERHRGARLLDEETRLLRWDLTAADCERLDGVARGLGRRSDEITKRYGALASLTVSVARAQTSPDDMKRLVEAYLAETKRRVASPELKDQPDARRLAYHLAYLADALLAKTQYADQCSHALLDFMLARHEFYRPFLVGIWRYRPIRDAAERAAAIDRERRIVAAIDAPGFVNLSTESTEGLRANRLKTIAILERGDGVPADYLATTQPWPGKRTLIDVYDSLDGLQWVLSPVLHDRTVYAAGVDRAGENGPATLRLISVPLDGRPFRAGRRLPVTLSLGKIDPRKNISIRLDAVKGACVFEGLYCVATERQGLYLFPLDGAPPSLLNERAGLPTPAARSIAGLDGVLYAGMGFERKEGYLVAYDLRTKQVNVLAASGRKEQRSPFDDGTPFEIRGLVADPPRHRLLVVLYRPETGTTQSGVWEFAPTAPEDRRWRQLVPMRPPSPAPPTHSPLDFISTGNPIRYVGGVDGTRFPIATTAGIYAVDMAKDRVERIYYGTRRDFGPRAFDNLTRYPLETDAGEDALLHRKSFDSFVVIDGRGVWDSGNFTTWGWTDLQTGRRQVFGTPRDGGGQFVVEFIRPLDNGRVVVGDQFGLWILTIPHSPQ